MKFGLNQQREPLQKEKGKKVSETVVSEGEWTAAGTRRHLDLRDMIVQANFTQGERRDIKLED